MIYFPNPDAIECLWPFDWPPGKTRDFEEALDQAQAWDRDGCIVQVKADGRYHLALLEPGHGLSWTRWFFVNLLKDNSASSRWMAMLGPDGKGS